jgi:hypothetical protein
MGYIEDVRYLLKNKNITYSDFLDVLINLEREHATRIVYQKFGVSDSIEGLTEDIKTLQKITKIADRLEKKIKKKLSE